jgi:hypothetical protein
MNYMDMFQDPLAEKNDKELDQPLPQMPRPAPVIMPNKDPSITEQATKAVTQKGIDYGLEEAFKDGGYFEQGIGKMKGLFGGTTPAVTAPTGAQMSGLAEMAGTQGLSPGAAQAVLGSGSSAAPLVGAASGQTGAQLAGMGAQGLTSAATTGAAGAAGTGAMAGMAAAAPWLLGGLAVGKAFGLFNQGGPVRQHIGGMINMPGPLSGIRYKSEGGGIKEEVEFKYTAPLGG